MAHVTLPNPFPVARVAVGGARLTLAANARVSRVARRAARLAKRLAAVAMGHEALSIVAAAAVVVVAASTTKAAVAADALAVGERWEV